MKPPARTVCEYDGAWGSGTSGEMITCRSGIALLLSRLM
jgi:hypothetical protein